MSKRAFCHPISNNPTTSIYFPSSYALNLFALGRFNTLNVPLPSFSLILVVFSMALAPALAPILSVLTLNEAYH